MPRFAKDTVLLGGLGEIHAGDEVPTKWTDLDGTEQPTDLKRLDDLDVLHPDGWAPDDELVELDLDELKVADLKAKADELGIDVGDAKTRAELIAVIREHLGEE